MAYNSSRHSTMGYTPHLLMFRREMQILLEMALPSPEGEECGTHRDGEDTMDHFVRRMKATFRRVCTLIREHLQAAVVRQKEQYDKRARDHEFHRGQGVWYYNPSRKKGRTPKLDIPWEGPYAVVTIMSGVLCEIPVWRWSSPVQRKRKVARKGTEKIPWTTL